MISKTKIWEKPVKLHIQDLITKSDLLDGLKLDKELCAANEDTRIAHAFSEKIHRIYDGYEACLTRRSDKESRRWKHMRACLKEAGRNPDVRDQVELAKELGIHKNMVSDARLMIDGHRAGIDAVCLTLMGLGCLRPDKDDMAQEESEDREKSPRLVRALESRELAEALRRYFAGGVPFEKQLTAACDQETPMTQEEVSAAVRAEREKIQRIAAPFGYWLPDEQDEKERKARIVGTREAAQAFVEKKREEKPPKKEEADEKPAITQFQQEYLWLTRGKIKTLHDPGGAWSENPNRLHMIIASCSADACAAEIERAYHAFSLHPFGLHPDERKDEETDGQKGGALNCLKPFFPVDQVAVASIETFRPLLECARERAMRRRSGEKWFRDMVSAFWGLLYIRLNHCDRNVPAGFGLRDELFSRRGLTTQGHELELTEMLKYWKDFREEQAKLECAGKEGRA